jgi:serine/threonine-protein kinase
LSVAAPDSTSFSHPHYRIVRELARGSFTMMYEAESTLPTLAGRRVALKMLRHREHVAWFYRIARTTASLGHPGIVSCLELGETYGQLYMVLEFVPGADLLQQIHSVGPWPLTEVVHLVRRIANALDYTHGRGVIHGHLHPKHILLAADRSPRLTGFGAYPLDTDMVFGNPLHLAPEQIYGQGPWTTQTDVYALAETAFWILTGSHPFNTEEMMVRKTLPPFPSVRELRPDLSPAVDAVLQRGMTPQPAYRFDSASEFAEALALAALGPQHGKQ